MSINNNIQINDTCVAINTPSWENNPGSFILSELDGENNLKMTRQNAIGTFNHFINNKIPFAKELICKFPKTSFQSFHYPLPIKTVFLIFMDELIEHYQNQLAQRDEELDQDFIKLKTQIAKGVSHIWFKDKHEIREFLNGLKKKLASVNAVPNEFDTVIALWPEILSMQYIANMSLTSLFLPYNYVTPHQLPSSASFNNGRFQKVNFSYAQSQQTISLILREMSKNISWIVAAMVEKLPPSNNQKLEEDFSCLTELVIPSDNQAPREAASLASHASALTELFGSKNNQKTKQDFLHLTTLEKQLKELNKAKKIPPSVSSQVQKYINEVNNLMEMFYSLDLSDNKQIKLFMNKCIQISPIVCQQSQDYTSALQLVNSGGSLNRNGVTLNANSDPNLLKLLSNYSDCVHYKTNYIDLLFNSMMCILQGIWHGNNAWQEFKTHGTVPKLDSYSPPISNVDESEQYANSFLAELEEETKNKPSSKGKGKQNANNAKQKGKGANNSDAKSGQKGPVPSANPSKKKANASLAPTKTTNTTTLNTTKATTPVQTTTTNTTTTTTTTSTTATTTTTMTAVAPVTPRRIEVLRENLVALFEANPNSSLRQVIWHLDHLMVIQDTLANSALSNSEHLCLLSTVSNFAQKTLEQAYRFCLKQEQASFTTTHNLKTYHRKWAPSTAYPAVVRDLFLANHWQRYFYSQHNKWNSITTFQIEIPRVLDQLHKIAEGEIYSTPALNLTVEEIIKNTCEHVENLLIKQSNAVESTSQKQPPEPRKLEKAFSEKMFSNVQQTLEKFLPQFNAGHPFTLNVKQALAALKMLEVSLQQMNKAQNVPQFSTWTVWSLQQLQESMENVLHCIEYYQKNGEMGIQHELKTLAEELGLKMGSFAEDTQQLSYKVRYPSETKNGSLSAEIIDDLEAIKEFPDFEKGFKFQTTPTMLWGTPNHEVSFNKIAAKINSLLIDTEQFMREKALPALQKARDNYIASLAAST